jgi:hypothetical protein
VVSFTPTNSGGSHYDALVLDEIVDFNTSTIIEASGAGAEADTGSSCVAPIADTSNDCLKLGAASWWGGATTGSNGSGWTLDDGWNNNDIQAVTVVSKAVSGADTTDPTVTLSASDEWCVAGLAIRGASAGGGGGSKPWLASIGNQGFLT